MDLPGTKTMMKSAVQPLLQLSGIVKRFPGCVANDHVDLKILPGEIHALLGENGAGKSTLVKIIYGVQQPDEGYIDWQGVRTTISNPARARDLGIGMVFQHFSLFEALTVAENIALGITDRKMRKDLIARIGAVSESYGLQLDPTRVVYDLSVGERQRIEIVRCLLQKPKLLIMDEPTSVLTPQEAENLFSTLRRLAAEGCAILYISHKLDEIRALCERATIMRLGRVVAQCDPRQESAQHLAELMIGSTLKAPVQGRHLNENAVTRLAVHALSLKSNQQFGVDLHDINFEVAAGEILGIGGIAGNGQNELMTALSGEVLSNRPETIMLDNIAVGRIGPEGRRAAGGSFVPEERNDYGAVREMTLAENTLLSGYRRRQLVRLGMVDMKRIAAFAAEVIRNFDVRTTGPKAEARSLSGGNLQKFIVGREILQNPSLLVVAQPTWGVDAGAAATIHQALLDLATMGAAIIIISQDLDEIMRITDRIAIIARGRLSPVMPTAAATIEQIGFLMGGVPIAPGAELSHVY